MKITMIAALASGDNGIGSNGTIPWDCPPDLNHFAQVTKGKPVVMGRATQKSLPGGYLPCRPNIVLTRSLANDEYKYITGMCYEAGGIKGVMKLLKLLNFNEVIIAGGADIYALFMPIATHMIITRIEERHNCDRFFPPWNGEHWLATGGFTLQYEPFHAFVVNLKRVGGWMQ